MERVYSSRTELTIIFKHEKQPNLLEELLGLSELVIKGCSWFSAPKKPSPQIPKEEIRRGTQKLACEDDGSGKSISVSLLFLANSLILLKLHQCVYDPLLQLVNSL
jgi:hypothetical protein